MATADSLLLKDLQCSICKEEFCRPVTAGSCNHTFCKHCLQHHVEINARNGEFPCPLCRQSCKLPPNGIDGLTPNFYVANIITQYNEVRKQLIQLKWNSCAHCLDSNANVANVGSSLLTCPQCDGISLCDECGLSHINHPITKSHQVIALCKLHGKPLNNYCKSCGSAICVICFGKHSKISEKHDVVDYADLVKGDTTKLGEDTKAAGPASCQLKKQENELKTLMTEKKKGAAQVRETIVTDFKAGEDRIDESYTKDRESFKGLQKQMELLKKKMDEGAKRKRNIQEIKKSFLCLVNKDSEAEGEDVTAAIQNVIAMQGRIKESVARSDALVSQKLLKADLHDDIVETRNKLLELTHAAAIDRIASFREKVSPEYDLSVEYITAAGQFSSATSSFKLEIGKRDCYVSSVKYMSRDRIAASIEVKEGTYVVVYWNLPDKTANVLLQENVVIPYIASSGINKLVVLRRASPILKVIDVDTKATRNIVVDVPKEVIDNLWCVEVDDQGRFMVTYEDDSQLHTLLISNDGQLLDDLIVTGYISTFSRLSGMVTQCSSNAISCYRGNDDSLTKVMSAPHGVEGFKCTDICSGSFGEMFIVGWMEGENPQEIRLYQLLLDTDKKTVSSMKQIETTNLEAKSEKNLPKCSKNGNNLVIVYDETVQVLQLSA